MLCYLFGAVSFKTKVNINMIKLTVVLQQRMLQRVRRQRMSWDSVDGEYHNDDNDD